MFTNRMTSNLNLLFVFGSLSSFLVAALPTGITSYTQELKLSYIEGKWICDGIECPAQTFGCRVQRRNNAKDNMKLDEISTCFDEQKRDIMSSANTVDMPIARRIDIDVESHIGAVSDYNFGYGIGGHEAAHGIISPNDWDDFKNSSEKNKNLVDNS